MDVVRVLGRLRTGELHYVLGRFSTVRKLHRVLRRLFTPIDTSTPPTDTLFPNLDMDQAVEAIENEAVYLGLKLPDQTVRTIQDFCTTEPLFSRHAPESGPFLHADVKQGFRASGEPTPIGAIREPLRCEAVRQIADDPNLLRVVSKYLGYRPRRCLTVLYWSFASNFTDDERRAMLQHVIDYHYDVGGYGFVYVSFYLVDTNLASGAHVMIKRSHHGKKLSMLFGSAVTPAEHIYAHFGKDNEIVIEGPAGTGFIQDTACYHRASPPVHGDRLMLQMRYS